MKIAVIVVRVLMGLLFLFASIVVLFNLMPQPETTGKVKIFNEGIAAAGYFIPILKVIELICAISLLSGFYLRLFTIVLFPITIHIFLFHAFLSPEGLPVAIFLLFGNLFLAYHYRESYSSLLVAK
ncbi:hypothetical protein [Dyadobacter sp. NIV53]|uniref:hypothetical protein n=1 Tax=Dyadobacter sp. NIV53 TaxID=2861765 RepID=UPI001C881FDA|nr:hypothetical protein [Dyadobacter sp. NIV53]